MKTITKINEFYRKHLEKIETVAWLIACVSILITPDGNMPIIFALIAITVAVDKTNYKILDIEKQIEDALHMISVIEAAAVATDMRTRDMQSDS